MDHEPLGFTEAFLLVGMFGLPLIPVVAALVAALRLQLPSLWWLVAQQVCTGPVLHLYPLALARRMSAGSVGRVMVPLQGVASVVSVALFLVFVIPLMRDIRRLLANRHEGTEVPPAPA